MWLLNHAGIEVNPCWLKGAQLSLLCDTFARMKCVSEIWLTFLSETILTKPVILGALYQIQAGQSHNPNYINTRSAARFRGMSTAVLDEAGVRK